MTRTRTLRTLLVFTSLLAALGAATPAAEAGPLVASAGSCPTDRLEQPFLRWLDPATYQLLPRGSFESGTAGWRLAGASVVSGNEPFRVHGASDSRSLSLKAGGSATSPTMCVGLNEPTLRFFARSSGSLLSALKVEVLFENAAGSVLSAPIGVVTPGSWAPTLPLPVVVNLLPLLPGEQTPVQFRLTPVGSANWQVDDVYVDPRRH